MREKVIIDENLTIEKGETPQPNKAPQMRAMFATNGIETKTEVNANEVIDTLFSYLTDGFEIKESGKGNKCLFCDYVTSYSNRHICPDCWKAKKRDILEALKEKNRNTKIKV